MLPKEDILPQLPQIQPTEVPCVNQSRPKPVGEFVPERSQKRNLSTDSTVSPTTITQQDKKYRCDTLIDYTDMEPEQEVTMTDLLNLLKLTAKASDLDDIAKKQDLIDL